MSTLMNLSTPLRRLSASQRSADRWFNVDLSAADAEWHRNLMAALAIDEPVAPVELPQGHDWTKWRSRGIEQQNLDRRRGCRVCRGTGEMRIYIDLPSSPCPTCQLPNPYQKDDDR